MAPVLVVELVLGRLVGFLGGLGLHHVGARLLRLRELLVLGLALLRIAANAYARVNYCSPAQPN